MKAKACQAKKAVMYNRIYLISKFKAQLIISGTKPLQSYFL